MRHRFGPSRRPPWWPDNEPWPPHAPGRGGYVTRMRFFRRFALLAAVMMLCAVFGVAALGWLTATSLGIISSERRAAPMLLLAAGLVGAVGAVAAIVVLAGALRRVGGPLAAVMEAADRVAAGDYTARVAERGPPPIRALARAFNTMTLRLQDHDRLRRDLMADIAHELRTPLTIIQGRLEGLLDGVYPRDEAQLQQLLEETHVLSRLVDDLRTLALREPTDVAALAGDVVRALAGEAGKAAVTMTIEAPADLAPIEIDPVRIREVIGNLLSNALRHTPAGGSVTVSVTAIGGDVSVEVRDTGTGMTPADLAQAFDRFYKGAQSRGSGLGLTIARSLVAAHGGQIQASSAAGGGMRISFTLPKP